MTVDHIGVTMLARNLGKVPVELRKELRPKLRAAATVLVNDMKSRASYSNRIPGAIRMTVSFSGRGSGGGVKISVDSKRAPHARVLERGNLGGRASTFRHPVYAWSDNKSDWKWVTQPTRPFFFPAVSANRDRVKAAIAAAVKSSIHL